jgi:SAM-dependent methyltransferase
MLPPNTSDFGVQAAMPYCQACSTATLQQRGQHRQRQQRGRQQHPPAPPSSDPLPQRPSNRSTSRASKRRKQQAARIVVADTVNDYRRLVPSLVSSADIVLEVGCCNGQTTALLASHCRRAFGIDMSEPCLSLARERHAESARLSFHRVDAFDIAALCALRDSLPEGGAKFNKIFLDVNGSRDTAAVTKLISVYSEAWGTDEIELIVVKNWRLADLLRSSSLSAAVLGDGSGSGHKEAATREEGREGAVSGAQSAAVPAHGVAATHIAVATVIGLGLALMLAARGRRTEGGWA